MGKWIADILQVFQVYWAILWYYILKLPFGIRIFTTAGLILFIICLGFKLTNCIRKKAVLPLVFRFFEWGIKVLQRFIFWVVRMAPGWKERGYQIDDVLNQWGMKCEKKREGLKEKKVLKKFFPIGKVISILIIVLILFVLVPHYIEPSLTGDAKKICTGINQRIERFERKMQNFVNQYYTPVEKPNRPEPVAVQAAESVEIPIILHLGPEGINGANLRKSPEKIEGNIIQAVSGEIELKYEKEIRENQGTIWIKVSTEDIQEAWISKKLIKEEDLRKIE